MGEKKLNNERLHRISDVKELEECEKCSGKWDGFNESVDELQYKHGNILYRTGKVGINSEKFKSLFLCTICRQELSDLLEEFIK